MCLRPFHPRLYLFETKGFTLLEVMIAVSILAIGFVVLFGSQSRSISNVTEAKFNLLAPMLASSKFAELTAGSEGDVSSDEGDFADDQPGYRWAVEVEDATFDSLEILDELEKPLKRLKLVISMDGTGFKYSLVYYGRWLD
ncbi:MAG: prepilin-type N-terminal cleavage/methylation domain-containing protein [Desulfobulbaceae bacterium]|nr:prepilin-type N-terminal cleavage/methylation domain-containing protein [Desulfobulbaceae bacterium]